MDSVQHIKSQIDHLSTPEQEEIAGYLAAKKITTTQTTDILGVSELYTPFHDHYKPFFKKHGNNPEIQKAVKMGKINPLNNGIECNGIKFPIDIIRYDDIKNTKGLRLDNNVYKKDDNYLFTFDVAKILGQAGHKIPTKEQRHQAATVLKGYGLLGQLLNFSKGGSRFYNGVPRGVDILCTLWSSAGADNIPGAFYVWFANGDGGLEYCDQKTGHSIIFLQD